MKRFMYLGCRFSFEAYAKNVRENATKCSLKTTEVLLDVCLLDDYMSIKWTCAYPRLIIIKVQKLKIVLQATNSWSPHFLQKSFV